MKKKVTKPAKVALCRECGGTGTVTVGRFMKKHEVCPQCGGSGRVLVSCVSELDIRPYPAEESMSIVNKNAME